MLAKVRMSEEATVTKPAFPSGIRFMTIRRRTGWLTDKIVPDPVPYPEEGELTEGDPDEEQPLADNTAQELKENPNDSGDSR